MNYSLSTNRKQRIRKIVTSWIVIFIIGILIGWLIGNLTSKSESVQAMKQLKEVEPYGTIDGKTFTWGTSIEWTSGAELGFVPLEINMDEELQEFIYSLSYAYNLDYAFVMGLIKAESEFDTSVVSSTNDYGLMQINQINHDWLKEKLGITDFLDPYQNTMSGIYILRNLFEKYEEPNLVLMAYNMGETGASKLWDKGIYQTDYSIKVLKNAQEFTEYMEERTGDSE